MHSLIPGVVVTNVNGAAEGEPTALVTEPHLVLYVNTGLNRLVMIPTTARHKDGRHYFLSPRLLKLDQVEMQLNSSRPLLAVHNFEARPATKWDDEYLNKKFKRKGQTESVPLMKLKMRWELIEPLVTSTEKELLFDPEFRRALVEIRANEALADPKLAAFLNSNVRKNRVKCGKAFDETLPGKLRRVINEIVRCLNMFWAGGSVRGALIGFTDAMGGRGKSRKAGTAKRGRPSIAVKEGRVDLAGLNIEAGSQHAKIIKFSHDTWVIRGTTQGMALRTMWTEFYSVAKQQSDGSTKMEWLPVEQRPTLAQFTYWGTKDDAGSVAWRKHLPPTKFDKSYRAVMGSASDDVYAIGQRGGIDSTPPDLQFVRAIDRLARVGGGHRIIVVDAMFGYIPGLYMGFDAPSADTVQLALYSAMDPDKKGWLEDLSLDKEIQAEHFVPIVFENLWADNTDLRNEAIKRCAQGIGTNIHFIPKMRSDLNPLAESGHHILHRLVDHKLSGSTYGRFKERGEASATDRARHTMLEGIREVVRAIHVHNTAEVEDNRPLRMRMNGVPPTRLAMTLEMIRLGRIARTAHAIDLGRRQLLPRYEGTFTEKGIRLHRRNGEKKVEFIKHIVYTSDHPIILRRCEEARGGGKLDPDYFRASFLVNPYRPRRIWHVDLETGEEMELTFNVLKVRDPDLPYVMTIPDMIDRDRVEASERIELNDARDRKLGEMEAKQRAADAKAEEAYQVALESIGRTPSRAELRRDKRDNRDAEKAECMHGMPVRELAENYVSEAGGEAQPAAQPEANETVSSKCESDAPSPATPTEAPPRGAEQSKPRNSLLRAAIQKLSKNAQDA